MIGVSNNLKQNKTKHNFLGLGFLSKFSNLSCPHFCKGLNPKNRKHRLDFCPSLQLSWFSEVVGDEQVSVSLYPKDRTGENCASLTN